MPRSPRGVCSITLGTIIPLGSIMSRVSRIHFGSFGLNVLPILAPLLSETLSGLPRISVMGHYRQELNVQRNSTKAGSCTVMITPGNTKRKHSTDEFSRLSSRLLKVDVLWPV